MLRIKWAILLFICFFAVGCGSAPYFITGKTVVNSFTGYASWYGPQFHGKRTSSGEIFNMYNFTAAHRFLPFGTYIQVTNLNNGKKVMVRINDRGPFCKNRIIDLSYKSALEIDLVRTGTAKVRVEVIQ